MGAVSTRTERLLQGACALLSLLRVFFSSCLENVLGVDALLVAEAVLPLGAGIAERGPALRGLGVEVGPVLRVKREQQAPTNRRRREATSADLHSSQAGQPAKLSMI